jgi:magnesium transporter
MKAIVKQINSPQTRSFAWNNVNWVDISFPTSIEMEYLANKYHFHPLALEDSLSRSQLSKVDDYGSYLLLILHFPVIEPVEQVLKSTWLAAFIGVNYVITLHDEFKLITDIFVSCQTEDDVKKAYFSYGSGYFIYHLIDHLIENCFPILDRLLAQMELIEDRVFDEESNDTQAIAVLRRDIITLRRIIYPSRSVFSDLKQKIKAFTSKDLDVYFDNLMDEVNRIWENLEESKEVIEVFKDSDFVLVTNRINRIVQTLTILSSVFIPFIVVSSLYGMNVKLPGGFSEGSLVPFGVLLGIMFIISGTMLYFFHRRHWI